MDYRRVDCSRADRCINESVEDRFRANQCTDDKLWDRPPRRTDRCRAGYCVIETLWDRGGANHWLDDSL